ncbi:MAG: hypothetical protein L3V56_03630 [Candidatus Magnetoovum sp. WYHC-5]|nr:hypothetical protein [Candidatus Magnetoovum sp. WYHC-5]
MNDLTFASPAGDIVQSGGTLQQVRTPFATAVSVQRPRVRKNIVAICEEEADMAGDAFFYSWSVKSKKTGKSSVVEGPSVDLALTAARNWGNCGVAVDVREENGHYILSATFVDLETGYNLQRAFRQRKTQDMGMQDKDRSEDIVFQIGQSKAVRNVILSALPSWLIDRMLERAKANVVEKIKKKGLAKAKEDTMMFFERHGVSLEMLEGKLGLTKAQWTVEDVARLAGDVRAIMSGEVLPSELFPSQTQETKAPPRKEPPKKVDGQETKTQSIAHSELAQILASECDGKADCIKAFTDMFCSGKAVETLTETEAAEAIRKWINSSVEGQADAPAI